MSVFQNHPVSHSVGLGPKICVSNRLSDSDAGVGRDVENHWPVLSLLPYLDEEQEDQLYPWNNCSSVALSLRGPSHGLYSDVPAWRHLIGSSTQFIMNGVIPHKVKGRLSLT